MIDRIALLLLIIGGINWGLVGIFQFDLVAFLFGGAAAILSRIIYVLVAISAIILSRVCLLHILKSALFPAVMTLFFCFKC